MSETDGTRPLPATSEADAAATGATAATLGAVNIKLPAFWPADPEVWFSQVEAQISTRGITSLRNRYDYIVAFLSPKFATKVRDIILVVPDCPYNTLKR